MGLVSGEDDLVSGSSHTPHTNIIRKYLIYEGNHNYLKLH